MKNVMVTMDEQLWGDAKNLSIEMDISFSQFVRKAIRYYYKIAKKELAEKEIEESGIAPKKKESGDDEKSMF